MFIVPIRALSILFIILLFAGVLALLPLFRGDFRRLIRSALFLKAIWWIPIFLGFLVTLYAGSLLRLVIALAIIFTAAVEWQRQYRAKTEVQTLLQVYFAFFAIAVLQLFFASKLLQGQDCVTLLITVFVASPLSDVLAFFLGSYAGRHHLPEALNSKKSWEGAAGQFLGALLGVLILKAVHLPVFFWLWLPIGLGTAVGDLTNSYVKRRLGIKDWGMTIPGHGGFLDRFSSLFGGLAVALWAYLLIYR